MTHPQTDRRVFVRALARAVRVGLFWGVLAVLVLHPERTYVRQTAVPIPLLHVRSTVALDPQDAYVQIIVQDTKRRQIGLSLPGAPLAYSVMIQNGQGTVIEGGQIKKTFTTPTGTIVRIHADLGVVTYLKNGAITYTSPRPIADRATIDTQLEDAATVLGRITYCGGS